MRCGFARQVFIGAGVAIGVGLAALPAQAKQVCGWYAIVFCSSSSDAAYDFANEGWGQVIRTSDYSGFRRGLFCVVSGPQSKASAQRDMRAARSNGVAADAYIKRACTDESNLGD